MSTPRDLQDLGLDEVADAALGHDRDGDRVHDLLDLDRVGHAGHAALGSDVRRNPLQRHDRHRAGFLGDAGLVGVGDVHDHSSLLHLGKTSLYQFSPKPELGHVEI